MSRMVRTCVCAALLVAGALAMPVRSEDAKTAASDYPATRLGLTEPRDWTATDWVSDVLPHMAFGVVTATAFEAARD